jgi:RNA polymerase sigma factor (TIGR02999 family)
VAEDLTHLLGRWHRDEPGALGDLMPAVYAELRSQARRALRRERGDHTLQPTALVHEAFLRLVPQQRKRWQNRQHFFAVCAALMRQVLVDHARRRAAAKRGSGALRIPLEEVAAGPRGRSPEVDLLPLDRALADLARIDAARASLVEMRAFAGMTVPEIARVLGRSEWEVTKDWKLARAWLARRLRPA